MSDSDPVGSGPLAITEQTSCYAGYRTRELSAPGAGRTVVLLHGFGHPSDCWRPVLTRFAVAGQPAVAVDLPGFGAAAPLRSGPMLAQLDSFVDGVVRAHSSAGTVVLMGNSLGGLLAVRAAHADRGLPLEGVVALNAAGFGWTTLCRIAAAGAFRPVAALAGWPTPAAIRGPAVDWVVARLLYGRRELADPEMVRLLTDQVRDYRAARVLLGLAVRVLPEVKAIPPIGPITCPTIVIHGRRDPIVSIRASRRLHDAIPGSRLILLSAAGHCPHLDAPARVAAAAIELATAVQPKPA